MGVDYTAIAGFGIDVEDNLNDEDIEEVLSGFKTLSYAQYGSCYSGDIGYFILVKRLSETVSYYGSSEIDGEVPNEEERAELRAVRQKLFAEHKIETLRTRWLVALHAW